MFVLAAGLDLALTQYVQLENCPSRMTGKSIVVLKKHIFIEKCNKAAHKN
jgi:hypothetical protein